MPHLTPTIVSNATGIPEGERQDGICERALNVEPAALGEVQGVVGASVFAAIADTGSAYYAEFRDALAQIAVARILPTIGSFRASAKGGLIGSTGPAESRERFLTPAEVKEIAGQLRQMASDDLRRIGGVVADASEADLIESPPPAWAI